MLRWESPRSTKLRVGLIGFGDVARQIVSGCQALKHHGVEVVGVLTRTSADPTADALETAIPRFTDLSDLLAQSPTVIVTAASSRVCLRAGYVIGRKPHSRSAGAGRTSGRDGVTAAVPRISLPG